VDRITFTGESGTAPAIARAAAANLVPVSLELAARAPTSSSTTPSSQRGRLVDPGHLQQRRPGSAWPDHGCTSRAAR